MMEKKNTASAVKPRMFNCHAHIFTGDHVPPYLARTFLPWPLYYLTNVSALIYLFRKWFNGPDRWKYKAWYKNLNAFFYKIKMLNVRYAIVTVLGFLVGLYISLQVIFILIDWMELIQPLSEGNARMIKELNEFLQAYWLVYIPKATAWKIVLVVVLFAFFKNGRNLVLFILRKLWSFLDILPGSKTKALAGRYLNLGRFAFYKYQARIFGQLRDQYPNGTAFIILPMDMEFMGAGKVKAKKEWKGKDGKRPDAYGYQMNELERMKSYPRYKDILHPFVCVDPRRTRVDEKVFFAYRLQEGKVVLDDCFIKDYIEEKKFSGFKIYPPLGYYPFEEALLPLWKYAADNQIPIMTHACRGVIYYRGKKKKEWDSHPVFLESRRKGKFGPLRLMETRNSKFTDNFTHPLNYLCLLDEALLRKVVGKASEEIKEIFGYKDEQSKMASDLCHLKLCFGHFGGDDEWARYFDSDRDQYSKQLVKHPNEGVDFLTDIKGASKQGKIEQIWKHTDWFTIICSLMLQYDNVYADVSFILKSVEIQALLNLVLSNDKLSKRVLFGSDFYVVRHHNSDKHMLAMMKDELSVAQFDLIARSNPLDYLGIK